MTIFLTGATGYIGRAVSQCLIRAGHQVVGLTRSRQKAQAPLPAGLTLITGDLKLPQTYWQAALGCDVLIHAGFEFGPRAEESDRIASRALADCAHAGRGRRQLIYTSGIWVLGDSRHGSFLEQDPCHPPAIVAWRPGHERLALESAGNGVSVAVIRPGCVYGGCGGLYGMMLHSLFEDRVVRLIGGGYNRWASVYIEDLAELYRLVIETKPEREIYHATDGSSDTLESVAEAFIEAAGGGRIGNIPFERARGEFGALAEALAMDQGVSSEKARRQLGWRPVMASACRNAEKLLAEWHDKALRPAVA